MRFRSTSARALLTHWLDFQISWCYVDLPCSQAASLPPAGPVSMRVCQVLPFALSEVACFQPFLQRRKDGSFCQSSTCSAGLPRFGCNVHAASTICFYCMAIPACASGHGRKNHPCQRQQVCHQSILDVPRNLSTCTLADLMTSWPYCFSQETLFTCTIADLLTSWPHCLSHGDRHSVGASSCCLYSTICTSLLRAGSQ